MGPDDGNVNTTQNCEYDIANDIPCFEPLVWTTGPNRFNGPDPEELEELCANGGVRQSLYWLTHQNSQIPSVDFDM